MAPLQWQFVQQVTHGIKDHLKVFSWEKSTSVFGSIQNFTLFSVYESTYRPFVKRNCHVSGL